MHYYQKLPFRGQLFFSIWLTTRTPGHGRNFNFVRTGQQFKLSVGGTKVGVFCLFVWFGFVFLKPCPVTWLEGQEQIWLAGCLWSTDGFSNHLASLPPPPDNPQDGLWFKTLTSNLTTAWWKSVISSNTPKTEKKETKDFLLFLSGVGELMFVWYMSHLIVKWHGQRALAALPWVLAVGREGERGVTWPDATPQRTVAPDSFSHMQMSSRWSRTWWNVSRLGGAQEEHRTATAVWLHTVELMIWRHIVGE